MTEHHRVAIVGTGFAGLGMAIRLKQDGERRLRAPRARRRHRRHLAGQHLPGLPLRRALAPLLVLVRAQPGLVPHVLAAGGDPRLPEGLRRALRRAAPRPLRDRARRAPSGTTTRACGGSRRRQAPMTANFLVAAHGPAVRAGAARRAGTRGLRGHRLPLGPVGPRPRPRPASGWPSSAPARPRSSSSPQIQPKVGEAARLPAHRAVGHARTATGRSRALGARALPALPAGPAGDAGRHLLGARAVRAAVPPPAGRTKLLGAAAAQAHALADQGPGAAPEAHARLPHGLQAHPPDRRLVSRRSRSRTSRS